MLVAIMTIVQSPRTSFEQVAVWVELRQEVKVWRCDDVHIRISLREQVRLVDNLITGPPNRFEGVNYPT